MRQITDEMVKTIMGGSGVQLEGFVLSIDVGSFHKKKSKKNNSLFAISQDGQKTFIRYMTRVSQAQVKLAIERLLQDINSSTHLPESAYNNGIRLDTEHRCQNERCNPAGKRRLLFVSAGPMAQAMQVKCKCGWMNTFWNNRIDFDEYGALYMKTNRSGK